MTKQQNEPLAPTQPRNGADWIERFLSDLAVVRPPNTVRAYRHDLQRWLHLCHQSGLDPLTARSSHILAFIRSERERVIHKDATLSTRTIVRRLAVIRQWYSFLTLELELTGVQRNPVPGGTSLRTAAGVVTGQPALLHYDRLHPETLTADEIDRFLTHLTASSQRDRAIVFLLKDGAVRISEALALRLGAQMMRELDCTYWDFNWEKLLAWKQALLEREAQRPKIWRQALATHWSQLTATLFFLGVLPYSEEIYQTYHRHLADRWLGKERTDQIAARCIQAAESIGYPYTPALRKHVVGVLLSVLVYAGKTEVAALTKADLEGWQAHTRRTKRVTAGSVTCIQKVLAAMGHLGGEAPRLTGNVPLDKFGWGRTAPGIVATFERFLNDLKTTRVPATVNTYRVCLRRFGDWLGEYDPALQSVAELRRTHIEAYKRAVKQMHCGDYTNLGQEFVDIGIGWCGLTAYHPCETRLTCHSCPNYLPDQTSLPLLERQRANLMELRGLGSQRLGGVRRQEMERELSGAIDGIERSITALGVVSWQQEDERPAKGVLANANTKGRESHVGDIDPHR